jgi:hypothetical protein
VFVDIVIQIVIKHKCRRTLKNARIHPGLRPPKMNVTIYILRAPDLLELVPSASTHTSTLPHRQQALFFCVQDRYLLSSINHLPLRTCFGRNTGCLSSLETEVGILFDLDTKREGAAYQNSSPNLQHHHLNIRFRIELLIRQQI